MRKIAVIGDKDSVCGFACLGIEAIAVYDETQLKKEFSRLLEDEYAIIYITEFFAEYLKEELDKLSDAATPAVILIPGASGNTGEAMKSISKNVERAVGSLILD